MRANRICIVAGIVALLGCASGRTAPPGTAPSSAPPADGLRSDPVAAAIDSIASAFLRDGRIAGFSVGVLRGDSILFSRGYGWADLENRVPATDVTVYRIGSLTKPMTALAILQLAERGLLDLDDAIGSFFPDYPPPGSGVTVRHLLSMTSGIPNYTMDPRLDYFREQLPHDSVVALFRDRPLLFPPGERYDYSNSNYYLLGLLIEALSGKRYEEYIHDSIVEPLGLTATRYCPNRPVIPHRAKGHRVSDGELVNARPISVAWAYAAGGYCSTAPDQLRWIRALGTGALIGNAAVERMSAKTLLNSGVESGYGYGLAVDELRGHRQLSHAGTLDGFQASISYFPEDSLAVVVLANTESAGATDLKERIARHLLDVRPLTLADVADLPLTPGERRRYTGTYALETMQLRFTISDAGQGLQLSMGGQAPMRLLYQGNHRFVLADDLEASIEFTVELDLATRILVRTAAGNLLPGARVQ